MTDEGPVLTSVALGPQHLLRLPDEHASGIEGSAGRANRRRVDDASERLVLRFDHAVFQATANPVRVDLSTTADEVWEALDIVAHHDDLRPGRIELGMAESEQVDDHVHFDQSYGLSRPGLGSVAEKMAAGASILIHGIEFHLPELPL